MYVFGVVLADRLRLAFCAAIVDGVTAPTEDRGEVLAALARALLARTCAFLTRACELLARACALLECTRARLARARELLTLARAGLGPIGPAPTFMRAGADG